MTNADRQSFFEQVHIAFWPVLWWNLVALQLDCERARAHYGDGILIDVEVAWWGAVRIRRIYLPGGPEQDWQHPLIAASARLDAVFADAHALHILALNWIILRRRVGGQTAPRARPAICDSS